MRLGPFFTLFFFSLSMTTKTEQELTIYDLVDATDVRICANHEEGIHIRLVCSKCRMEFSTKNLFHIGARSIFARDMMENIFESSCDHEYEHVC